MPIVSNFNIAEKYQFKCSPRSYLPSLAYVPFVQEDGCKCRALVKEGDVVSEGQIIASPLSIIQNSFSANIHSPLPGIVKEIKSISLPDGKRSDAAVIALKGAFSFIGKKSFPAEWSLFSPESLQHMIADKGVINTFERPFSLASQFDKVRKRENCFVVLRLFDEDPSRVTDSFVASHYPAQVAEGTAIIATALKAKAIVLVASKKDGNPISTEISTRFFENIAYTCVSADSSKYPCGFKRDIVSLVKKEKNIDAQFKDITTQELFIDPETAFAVYEAVVCGIPMMSCFVHITGDCLKVSGILRVNIGTPIGFLAAECGGFTKKVAKIIVNGLYTGTVAPGFDVPITKIVKSILFLPISELVDPHYASCVRCGSCRHVCPEGLYPDLLYQRLKGMEKAVKKELLDTSKLCTLCALCNSVCPSRLPLAQSIAELKKERKYE